MTITEFLEARIAEDEEQARDWQDDWNYSLEAAGNRLLAECAAKRAIISTQPASHIAAVPNPFILRALAAVYEDHPDYRQEWAV